MTITLHIPERARLIKSKRNRLIVVDRERLEDMAGDGCGQPEAQYRRLIGPLGSPRR